MNLFARNINFAFIGLLIIGVPALIFASLFLGTTPIPVIDVAAGLFGIGSTSDIIIIQEIRLPRALAAFVAGACLGAAGGALQGLLRNPLADPGVLGVSSAAALGAVIVIYFNLAALSVWIVPVASISFALGATALLALVGAASMSPTRLILVGVGLSSFAGALTSLAMTMSPNPFALADLLNWLFGTVANRSFHDLALVMPFVLLGILLVAAQARNLTVLTLGEETAESLGVDLKRTRVLLITGASLLVGASVAVAGAIGFVGIIAPHLVRPLVGHDPAKVIAPAALLGGALLLGADTLIRVLPFDQEMRLGVVAALIGAPGFVWVAATTRRSLA